MAQLEESKQGKGIGKAMYSKVIDEAHSKGLKVFSDQTVETPAARVYESLKKDGYDIVTNPHGIIEPSEDIPNGALFGNDGKPVFEIRQKRAN